jgi:hypothetical protein
VDGKGGRLIVRVTTQAIELLEGGKFSMASIAVDGVRSAGNGKERMIRGGDRRIGRLMPARRARAEGKEQRRNRHRAGRAGRVKATGHAPSPWGNYELDGTPGRCSISSIDPRPDLFSIAVRFPIFIGLSRGSGKFHGYYR